MTLVWALLLEWRMGDPHSRLHPVAWFGRWAAWCESCLYADSRAMGCLAWLCPISVPFCLLWIGHMRLGWLFDAALLWLSIGWKSLFEHVHRVLHADTLPQARQAVGRIVSRDTACMRRDEARRAALESLAENASDAVLAPLFWFVVLGPLGAALYRMVNTLDAMWGYRNARYQSFGWCAARMDDAANWLPARITARLLLWLGKSSRWHEVKQQASTHASPNAGWPQAALAFAANIRLGGPVRRDGVVEKRPWFGPKSGRAPDAEAASDALRLVHRVLLLASAVALGVRVVL